MRVRACVRKLVLSVCACGGFPCVHTMHFWANVYSENQIYVTGGIASGIKLLFGHSYFVIFTNIVYPDSCKNQCYIGGPIRSVAGTSYPKRRENQQPRLYASLASATAQTNIRIKRTLRDTKPPLNIRQMVRARTTHVLSEKSVVGLSKRSFH